MKTIKDVVLKSGLFLIIITILCGAIYTFAITGVSQLVFPDKANGSIIEVDGKKYGSELLGQQFTDETHMWGRIMNIDTTTFTDDGGKPVMYAAPRNLSPTSEEFESLVKERADLLKSAHKDMADTPIPVDLVTCSGSGLDPHISVAAAEYQISRLVDKTGYTKGEIDAIVKSCTSKNFLGIFGESVVNVLEVNLKLDKILDV